MKTSNRQTGATFVKVADVLRSDGVISKIDDTYCEYLGGWNDQKVADRVGCPKSTVSTLRKQLFGQLRTGREEDPEWLKSHYSLEGRLRRLENWAKGKGYNDLKDLLVTTALNHND